MRVEKLLEAEAIINGKKISIINTEMDISVQYNFSEVKSVFGNFSYTKYKSHYTTKTIVKFTSDASWTYKYKIDTERETPENATIDFDNKIIKIHFYK